MSIRIYSKKACAIGPGANRIDGSVENFITTPIAFQDMTEKYKDDPTFKLAVSCGDITVIEKKATVSSASIVEPENEKDEEDEATESDAVEKFYEELRGKKAEEVKELAEKYGAEFIPSDKLSMNKKRVFEAYKLSIDDEVVGDTEG